MGQELYTVTWDDEGECDAVSEADRLTWSSSVEPEVEFRY